MRESGLAFAVLTAVVVAGLAVPAAEGRAGRTVRTVRLAATDSGTAASGRVSIRTRRESTVLSARFSRLAPDAAYRVTWGAAAEEGVPFVTDSRGRARLRRVAIPEGAADEGADVSVTDENGEPVLSCDPEAMPGMHDGGGMMGDMAGMWRGSCPQACMDHCANGGTCDESCHRDHGCSDASCCCGSMSGQGSMQGCGGMSHGGGSSDGSGGSSPGGMMGGMHGSSGGGTMHR